MTESSGSGRMGRVVREVAVWAAIALGTLLFLEGCASAVLFFRDRPNAPSAERPVRPRTFPDTLLGWRNLPGYANENEYGRSIALHTTPQGLRVSTGASTAASGETNAASIVCTGDSYTFGVGVADDRHWCALLGAQLGVPVFDLAQESYGLDQAYLWYRRDGVRLPHRVQVLGVTNAMLERAARADDNGWLKPRLVLEGDRLITRPAPAQTRDALDDAAFDRRLENLRIVQALRLLPRFDPEERDESRTDAARPVFDAVLRELAAFHASRGTRLLVAYLPTGPEARANRYAQRRRWLAGAAARHAIPFVDLTPAFGALRADSLDLAYVSRTSPIVDARAAGQYSYLGHAVVARVLAPELRRILPAAAAAVSPAAATPASAER